MAEKDYTVRLDAFEGPLDLLYYLVRKAEVEITDIPVARIADQYMEYLGGIERVDIDKAGEFLLMAATLTEIKSRVLGAASLAGGESEARPESEGDEADPLADLVKQLLEYKRFRDAADALEHRFDEWSRRFPAGRSGMDTEELRAVLAEGRELDIEDLSIVDLVEAFGRICETINFDRLGEHEVVADDTPIELHAEDMLDRLRREAEGGREAMTLRSIFEGRTRGEMLGLFLALLELVRKRAVRVRQEAIGGEIVVMLRAEGASDIADGDAERAETNPAP
ncbi:MAG TPA: segregation/condensation protein A [Phycisphaerales bacterium]|nr:segregation/condensation protein A [Phycisphaerales bacterium]